MDPIVVASILLFVALALVIIDLFIPTAGMFLILAVLAAVGSILFAFRNSVELGLTFMLMVFASVPILMFFFLKVWPHTAIGKRLIGRLPERSEYHWSSATGVQNVKGLIGCTGKTLTEMLPAGLVEIDGRPFESLTEGRTVPAGRTVRVLRVEMGRLVVAETEGLAVSPRDPEAPPTVAPTEEKLLDRPANELGLDSLNE